MSVITKPIEDKKELKDMIQEQIKIDMKNGMLSKDIETRDLLRVVIGEFDREDKNISDDRALAIIKKMVHNAKDQDHPNEVMILEKYLPDQMSEDEITNAVEDIITYELQISSMKDMGYIMAKLKKLYGGEYDGKTASIIVKKLLS